MNQSYYQGEGTDGAIHTSANTVSNYQTSSNGPVAGNGSANTNNYQSGPVSAPTNDTTGPAATTNKQGQSTGAEGNGPDFICRSTSPPPLMLAWLDIDDPTVLDKLEKKFGGERFNNHDNDAKNLGMNSITTYDERESC